MGRELRGGRGSQSYVASETNVEHLPSSKINSNPWSFGKGAEGAFPAPTLLSKEAGSSPEVLAEPAWLGRPQEIPILLESGKLPNKKNKETWGEAPPAPSPPTVRSSQTSWTVSTSTQRG